MAEMVTLYVSQQLFLATVKKQGKAKAGQTNPMFARMKIIFLNIAAVPWFTEPNLTRLCEFFRIPEADATAIRDRGCFTSSSGDLS